MDHRIREKPVDGLSGQSLGLRGVHVGELEVVDPGRRHPMHVPDSEKAEGLLDAERLGIQYLRLQLDPYFDAVRDLRHGHFSSRRHVRDRPDNGAPER